MKFSVAKGIAKGTKARLPVPFSLFHGQLPGPVVADDGSITYPVAEGMFLVDLRVLSSEEEDKAEAAARVHVIAVRRAAGETGDIDPKEGETLFDVEVMRQLVLLATVDNASPEDAPEPFFDEGIEALRALDRERVVLLYEHHKQWQARCSPRRTDMSTAQYIEYVTALAVAADDLPFSEWSPATQQSCMRTMARQLVLSRQLSALSTSEGDFTSTGSTPTPASH
jgi:hypothetical protein